MKYPAEPLTPQEVAEIIGQCSATSITGIRNRALLTMLYRSGLRISEALALTPADLDHAHRSIRVLHGKGDEATTRYWHKSADDALGRWIDKRRTLRFRGAPLFCTIHGTPLLDVYVRNLVKRLAREAGVTKRVHPHGFRHTFAVELDRSGMPIAAISKLLGHKRITTTAIYLDHISNSQAGDYLDAASLPDLRE